MLVLAACAALFVVLLRIPAVGTFTANALLDRMPSLPRASMRVREARGDWITSLAVHGFEMRRGDTLLVAADTARVRLRPWALLFGRFDLPLVEMRGVDAGQALFTGPPPPAPDRTLSWSDLLRGRFYAGPELRVGRLVLHDVRYAGPAVADTAGPRAPLLAASLHARDVRMGGRLAFTVDSLVAAYRPRTSGSHGVRLAVAGVLDEGRLSVSALELIAAESRVRGGGALALGADDGLQQVRLEAHAADFALADLRPFFGDSLWAAFPLDGIATIDLQLAGDDARSLTGSLDARLDHASVGGLALGPSRLSAALADGITQVRLDAAIEGAPLAVEGRLRPLETRPSYDLVLRMPELPRALPQVPGWRAFARRAPFATEVSVRGRGYADAEAEIDAAMRGPAGTATLHARIDRTGDPAWTVDRLVFDRLDVARLTGDTLASFVSGALFAHGGTRDGEPWLQVRLDASPSSYRGRSIETGRLHVSLDRGAWGASLAFGGAGGELVADTLTWRMDGASAFRGRGVRMRGLDLAALAGDSTLASDLQGVLEFEGRGLAALGDSRGPLDALRSGRFTARASARLEPSTLRGRGIREGRLDASLENGRLVFAGEAVSDAGALRVDGLARPFESEPALTVHEARFTGVDVLAWAGVDGPSDVTGSLFCDARMSAAGRPTGSARLTLAPSRLGPLGVDGASFTARAGGGRTVVDGTVRMPGGTAGVRLVHVRERADSLLRVRADVPLGVIASLLGRDSLASDGALRVDYHAGRSTAGGAAGRGSLSGRGRVAEAVLDTLELRFRTDAQGVSLDTLVLASNVLEARGHGTYGFAGTTRFGAEVHLVDGAPLDRLLAPDSLRFGRGTFRIDASGDSAERRVEAAGGIPFVTWSGWRVSGLEAAASARLDPRHAPRGATVTLAAKDLQSDVLSFGRTGARGELVDGRIVFDVTSAPAADHRFRAAGAWQSDSAASVLDIEALEVVADSTRWALARPGRVRFALHRLSIDDLEVRSGSGYAAARGVLDRRGEQTLAAEVGNFDLDVIGAWIQGPMIDGTLDGTLGLSGPATDAHGDGTVRLALRSNGRPAGTLRSTLDWHAGGLEFAGAFTAAAGESLTIRGDLPLALSLAAPDSAVRVREGEVDAVVHAERFPLAALAPFLEPQGVEVAAGRLDADVRLTGTSRALRGEGRFDIEEGAVHLPAAGARYTGVTLAARIEGDRIRLGRLEAQAGKGRLEASGEIRLVALDRIEPDLEFRARRALLVDERRMRVLASGDLTVAGTFGAPVVRGRAVLSGSHYQLSPEDADAQDVADVTLTPDDLRMMHAHFVDAGGTAQDPAAALYEAIDLELDVDLERDNWIRQPVSPRLAVEVSGEVRVVKRPGEELLMYGRLAPVAGRGYIQQFGRSFDFTGGEVLLNGAMADHRIDVRTAYRGRSGTLSSAGSDIVVNLDVRGTPDALELELSSEPALSETEIVSFIATGRDPNALRSADDAGSGAGALARDIGLSQVSGRLEEAAQQSIGLDVLQVRYDALQGATLVAGRYLDPSVYVGFRQPLQYEVSPDENTGHAPRTRVEIEYEAYRWLVLNLQGEMASVRSFIRVRREY